MDLKTDYLGLELEHPLVVSACQPLSKDIDSLKELEEGGAAAVVLYSLFEEQVIHESVELDHYLSYEEESFAEAQTFFPEMEDYQLGPDEYLSLIQKGKAELDIPVIGSLNGVSSGGWVDFSRKIEEAGADALELNIFYIPIEPEMSGAAMEQRYIKIVNKVREQVDIPLSVKVGPYFSSIAAMVENIARAGADGVTLFNRFYQPDFDIENLEVKHDLKLSRSYDMRLPLRWTALLYDRVDIDLAITSGVHTYRDVIKGIMAGAKVTTMASELLENGSGRMKEITKKMSSWMEDKGYKSLKQMQGSMSQKSLGTSTAIERANYTKTLHSWKSDPMGQDRGK